MKNVNFDKLHVHDIGLGPISKTLILNIQYSENSTKS